MTTQGLADFYESAAADGRFAREVVNLLLTELLRFCSTEPFSSPVSATRLHELATLLGEGSINYATAKKLLLRLTEADLSPREVAHAEGLLQIRDPEQIMAWIRAVLQDSQKILQDYQNGKTNALRALQGRLMARSGGRAEPMLAERLLTEAIQNYPEQEDSDHV